MYATGIWSWQSFNSSLDFVSSITFSNVTSCYYCNYGSKCLFNLTWCSCCRNWYIFYSSSLLLQLFVISSIKSNTWDSVNTYVLLIVHMWRLSRRWSCFTGSHKVQTARGKQFVYGILWRPCTCCCKRWCFWLNVNLLVSESYAANFAIAVEYIAAFWLHSECPLFLIVRGLHCVVTKQVVFTNRIGHTCISSTI